MEIFSWRICSEDSRFLVLTIHSEDWRQVDAKLFLKHLSPLKKCRTKEEVEMHFEKLEHFLAKKEAFRLLAAKSRLSSDVRLKLKTMGFSGEVIERVLKLCTRLGFLDDSFEITRRIESEKRRGYGPRKIAWRLKSQGVPEEAHARIQFSEQDQIQSIQKILQKKIREKEKAGQREKSRWVAALQRRGFTLEVIFKAIDSLNNSTTGL